MSNNISASSMLSDCALLNIKITITVKLNTAILNLDLELMVSLPINTIVQHKLTIKINSAMKKIKIFTTCPNGLVNNEQTAKLAKLAIKIINGIRGFFVSSCIRLF
jgi:hypothetical protein